MKLLCSPNVEGQVATVRSLSEYARYIGQVLAGFRVKHETQLAQFRSRDVAPLFDGKHSQRVLDRANGSLRPQYYLLRYARRHVFGVDLVNRPAATWTDVSYRAARWWYRRQPGYPIGVADDTLAQANVNRLPFADHTFDLVTSIAAFEHFLNVPQVMVEIHRILRPGGVAWILIHLISYPSGEHSLTQIPLRHLPRGVEAWDHLCQRRLPFHVPLNEWRIQQYVDELAKHFEILKHYCAMRKGEELLTPEIEAELSGYSRDELTCGAYVIVARKI